MAFDKLILVFYVDMRHVDPQDYGNFMKRFAASATPDNLEDDDGLLKYFIPTQGESRVECLNVPTYIGDNSKLEELEKKIKDIDEKLDRFNSKFMVYKREMVIEKIHKW